MDPGARVQAPTEAATVLSAQGVKGAELECPCSATPHGGQQGAAENAAPAAPPVDGNAAHVQGHGRNESAADNSASPDSHVLPLNRLATPASWSALSSSSSFRLSGSDNQSGLPMEKQRMPWHRRCAALIGQFILGSLVVAASLATIFLFGMTSFLFSSRGLHQPCHADILSDGQIRSESVETWSPSMLTFYHHVHCTWGLLRALAVMPGAVWLLAVAQTPDLRRAASFATLTWGNAALAEIGDVAKCYDPSSLLSKVLDKPSYAAGLWLHVFGLVQYTILVVGRLEALQASLLDRSAHINAPGLRRQMHAIASVFLLGLPILYLADRLGYPQVAGVSMLSGLTLLLVFYASAARSLVRTLWLTRDATRNAPPDLAVEAWRAVRTTRAQLIGFVSAAVTNFLYMFVGSLRIGWLWPIPEVPAELEFSIFPVEKVAKFLDGIGNVTGALALSGALSGAASGAATRAAATKDRRRRSEKASEQWSRAENMAGTPDELVEAWDGKVTELAQRGITLRALLQFYRGLGSKFMAHYDPRRHTTSDVVFHAIIPLSSARSCAGVEVLMKGERARPQKMVTHNWSNLFRDLVAAIVADALGEPDFRMISFLLMTDLDQVERWVSEGGLGSRSYWVCAFAVNQHLSICGGNPHGKDSLTGKAYPKCTCCLSKAWNNTKPTLPDGRSIPCEMNKFDEIMHFLSATDPAFEQVVAIDVDFTLFTRAWCISEIATANTAGMLQRLKVVSATSLAEHAQELRMLKIEAMEATRPEDKQQILDSIDDKAAFNSALQRLLFEDLLPAWDSLDGEEQLARVGRIMRWQQVRIRRGTTFMWDAIASL